MRTSVLEDWISSKTKVVVATVAFGYVFPFNFCIKRHAVLILSPIYVDNPGRGYSLYVVFENAYWHEWCITFVK
jgi:hypothetical protein